jgi:putative membrane protein
MAGGEMKSSVTATLSWAGIFSVAVGLSMVSAQSSPARRQPPPVAATSATSSAGDHDFVVQAALANMAEIQLGHLAGKKAKDGGVKKFAKTMVDDSLKVQQRLAKAGYGEGIKWPTQLDDRHLQIQKRLSDLSGEQFDREYMQAMLDGHRDMEKLLAPRAESTGEGPSLAAKVNELAANTVPAVRAHLKAAEQVSSALAK